jgi:hypothetical protein
VDGIGGGVTTGGVTTGGVTTGGVTTGGVTTGGGGGGVTVVGFILTNDFIPSPGEVSLFAEVAVS